ncbi:MAG: hypothetical protein LBH75_04980, partial [Treponema sp.]|nr:hypothetical protein [Treponema sp.]
NTYYTDASPAFSRLDCFAPTGLAMTTRAGLFRPSGARNDGRAGRLASQYWPLFGRNRPQSAAQGIGGARSRRRVATDGRSDSGAPESPVAARERYSARDPGGSVSVNGRRVSSFVRVSRDSSVISLSSQAKHSRQPSHP